MAFQFVIDTRQLEDNLKELPKAMGRTVLRNALKKAAKPIRDEASANAPHGPSGNLAKSIVITTKRNGRTVRNRRGVTIFVGADHITAPHAHLVEFGTVERFHRKSGKSVGIMPQHPFFTRAFETMKSIAMDILLRELRVELDKAASRLAKRAESGKLSKTAIKHLLK